MRKLNLTFFVLVLLLSSMFCQLSSPKPSSQTPSDVSSVPVDTPPIDYAASVEPINVSVQLDDTHTQSGLFSPNGSTMSLTAEDETHSLSMFRPERLHLIRPSL